MKGNDVKWCHVLTSFGIEKKFQRVVALGMTLYTLFIYLQLTLSRVDSVLR